MNGSPRLAQVARMLHLPHDGLEPERAREAISARPNDFADALFAEAADNDDVTSPAAALDYLETRLGELAALVDAATAEAVRSRFRERLRAWE